MSERLLTGLIPAGPMDLDRHIAIHGPLPDHPADLIAEVGRAGLRGRGGAGFPTATKLEAVAAGRRPVVVVNGTEGEPMSAKDRILLHHVPHLVLDGAQAAARAVGARDILVCASEPDNAVLAAALAQRAAAARQRRMRVRLTARAHGYVAGEETAVLAHLEGRPPLPRVTPPRPAQAGYRGRPTLVQNVETLAHIGLIARHGASWFAEVGTGERPGTTLVTVSGAVDAPGVYEVPGGAALDAIVDAARPDRSGVRALLVGGYFGAWIGGDGRGLMLDDAALKPQGAAVGAGVVVVLSEHSCPIAETARLSAYLAGESAGQCGPCVHGLAALAGVMQRFATGRTDPQDGERLMRWIDMVRGRGACAHPDGAARMILSAVRAFRAELEEHAIHGPCRRCNATSSLVLPAVGVREAA
jgi:NADH:ubiquinone oxidoreductase subunit F (NADH-binding)